MKPDRETLVLIHGSGGSSQSWLLQLSGLNGEMNLVAVDLPGHGKTQGGPMYRIEDYASWLKEFIEATSIAPCYVLGHSLGGAITQRLALDEPDMLKGIILAGTGARLKVTPKILERIKEDFYGTVAFIVKSCYSKEAPEDIIRQGIELTKQLTPEQLYANFTACDHFDTMDQIERIKLPTLIVVGREDVMTPVKYSQFLNSKIEGSRLVILDKGGHGAMHENPQDFNRVIRDFICGGGDT